MMTDETLLEFPCQFPIKVVTVNDPELEPFIRETLAQHVDMASVEITIKQSEKGNYQSFSILLTAKNKAQLDALYQAFSSNDKVKMVL